VDTALLRGVGGEWRRPSSRSSARKPRVVDRCGRSRTLRGKVHALTVDNFHPSKTDHHLALGICVG